MRTNAFLPLNAWSETFALILAAVFLGVLATVILINQYNRDDMDTENAAVILTQLRTFGGSSGSVVVSDPDEVSDPSVVENIRALFRGETPDVDTTRSALAEMTREVRRELRARKPDAPGVPIRALQEAVLTAVFGAIAVVPLAAWRNAVTGEGGGGLIPTITGFVVSLGDILAGFVGFLASFPYLDILFAFLFAFGIITIDTLWKLWVLPPALLTVLAVSYFSLDYYLETDFEPSGPSVSGWTTRLVTLFAITWFSGITLAALVGVVPGGLPNVLTLAVLSTVAYAYISGTPTRSRTVRSVVDGYEPEDVVTTLFFATTTVAAAVSTTVVTGLLVYAIPIVAVGGAVTVAVARYWMGVPVLEVIPTPAGANWKHSLYIGGLTLAIGHKALAFLAALAIATIVSAKWIRQTLIRWGYTANNHGRAALALDIVHSTTITVAAFTVPLLVGYAVAAIITGKVFAVAGIILSAGGQTALAVGLLLAAVGFTAALVFADRFRDVRRGISRALSVRAVRSVLFARTLPFVLMFVIAVFLLAIGLNVILVAAVALTAGVLARTFYFAMNHIRYRAHTRESGDGGAARVVINGRTVTDSDDETVYIADTNGHRTAHRELDALIAQIQDDTRSLLRDGEPESGSFARYFYENGVLRGKVDIEAVGNELLGDIRSRFEVNVRETDADAEDIMETLHANYPDYAVNRVIADLKDRGRVMRREDTFEWMGD